MRLTHLKLAGFKSFVDPTIIHLHGQRVGVVGPNGCGKSNVMESVRWVLGESSAKEMRADGMDAVIFNGAANRKPISRASVELIFDNSLGGASGEWNQYAEISVKRVIEREKGSSYFINNTAVRRRDVADLFLGTGLGGRGYAIIGQNTISRIVEAKPEEMRIFLEEAAGISKYKERRRETETRLRDTRENLTRVEDICREMQVRITKLASQAQVAEQYQALQAALKHAEGQLWLLKQRDASRDWEKSKSTVDQLVNALEAQMAALRSSEHTLETTRLGYSAASEGINQAQAHYYEANAEVSNLEHQVKQTQDARERVQQQLQQLQHGLTRNAQQQAELQAQSSLANTELAEADAAEAASALQVSQLTQRLPDQDAALKLANTQAQTSQQALQQAKQRSQIEQNNVQYLTRNLQETMQRLSKLQADLAGFVIPDMAELNTQETQETQLAQLQAQQLSQEHTLRQLSADEAHQLQQLNQLRSVLTQAQRDISQADAEINALQKLQRALNSEASLSAWLNQQGLDGQARLWQAISVEPAWQLAFEAVLGNKLNALISDQARPTQRPPSALVLALSSNAMATPVKHASLVALLDHVTCLQPELQGLLQEWLTGVYVLAAEQDLAQALSSLATGECVVNAAGDVYTQHSVSYYAAQSQLHGVLERQQQLATLTQQQPALTLALEQAQLALSQQEQALQAVRQQQVTQGHALKQTTAELHTVQLTIARLKQTFEHAKSRELAIKTDIEHAQHKQAQLTSELSEKQSQLALWGEGLAALEQTAQTAASAQQHTEQAYFALRDSIQKAEKFHQECVFNKKLIINKINELNNKIKANSDEKNAYLRRQTETEHTLTLTPMETLKANLNAALNKKQLAEAALAQARNHLAEQEQYLQTQEKLRLQQEQQLHPLRDQLEQSRLKEQQARLYFEQCQAALAENGIAESALAAGLTEQSKSSELSNKTLQLQRKIDDLGAVNLAAIVELATEQERKTYLDSQMLDLSQASQTLEDAIRKIDRETRGKLQATFDEANRNFNELFNVLFAGGQAKLELLGEEILDTGIQVFAQPPGKKNTTIQMLSGGEKALTAMALVFALFRLNPAPFCLMDEVDAPLDDSNTERFCGLVKKMSERTQFLFVSHNKITMEMAQQLIGVTMQESGVSRVVDVDIEAALSMQAA